MLSTKRKAINAASIPNYLITSLTVFDVLVLKLLSPPYVAVIEYVPAEENLILYVAVPLFNATVPSIAVPFRKVTVSVFGGVPAPGTTAVTIAVKVMAVAVELAGLGATVRAVVVLALFTV